MNGEEKAGRLVVYYLVSYYDTAIRPAPCGKAIWSMFKEFSFKEIKTLAFCSTLSRGFLRTLPGVLRGLATINALWNVYCRYSRCTAIEN